MTLREYIEKYKPNIKELAFDLGVTPVWISKIKCNKVEPSLMIAAKIHNYTKGEVTFSDLTNIEVEEF